MTARRFPYEPLARIVAVRMGLVYCPGRKGCPGCAAGGDHAGPPAVGRYLGFHESAPRRWVTAGIPEESAERAAHELGLDPALVPGWDWYGEVDLDDEWLAAWDEGRVGPDGEIRPYGPHLSEVDAELGGEHFEQGSLFELAS